VDIRPTTWKRIFEGGPARFAIFFAAFGRLIAALVFFVAFRRLPGFGRAALLVVVLAVLREGREPRDLADLDLFLRAFIWIVYGFGFPPDKRQFELIGDHRRSFTRYPA
jgi:hypothetical protein